MTANNNQPIVAKETNIDGSTTTWTVNTNGGNYNKVQGTVVQGDVYERGVKKPKA